MRWPYWKQLLDLFAQMGLFETELLLLQQQGLKPLDALHLASAEAANVDYFVTVDDKLLAQGKKLARSGIRVVTPIELIEEINQ